MGLESEKIPTGPFKSPAVQTAAPFSPGLVGVDHGHTWLGVIRRFDVRFDGLKSGEVPLEGVWKNGPFKGAGSHFVGKTKWFIYVFYSCKYTWYMMIQIIVYIYIYVSMTPTLNPLNYCTWIFQVCQNLCLFTRKNIQKGRHFTYLEDPGIVC